MTLHASVRSNSCFSWLRFHNCTITCIYCNMTWIDYYISQLYIIKWYCLSYWLKRLWISRSAYSKMSLYFMDKPQTVHSVCQTITSPNIRITYKLHRIFYNRFACYSGWCAWIFTTTGGIITGYASTFTCTATIIAWATTIIIRTAIIIVTILVAIDILTISCLLE